MNNLSLDIFEVKDGKKIQKDGLVFEECCILRIAIDGNEQLPFMEDSLPVYEEIVKSADGSGRFLIFTCACGVADDAGWDIVEVTHYAEIVTWEFEYKKSYKYSFDKKQYIDCIRNLIFMVEHSDLELMPDIVVFPEKYFQASME